MSNDLKPLLARLAGGATLTEAEAEQAFDLIMSGEATPARVGHPHWRQAKVRPRAQPTQPTPSPPVGEGWGEGAPTNVPRHDLHRDNSANHGPFTAPNLSGQRETIVPTPRHTGRLTDPPPCPTT
jgi:glycosyl transferase family protein with helical bundle domain